MSDADAWDEQVTEKAALRAEIGRLIAELAQCRRCAAEDVSELRAEIEHRNKIAAQSRAEIERLLALLERAKQHLYNPFEPDNQSKVYKDIIAFEKANRRK